MHIEIKKSQVYLGGFIKHGESERGRLRVLIFGLIPCSTKLEVVNKIEHSPDCIQYFLRDDTDAVIGSMFEVRKSSAVVKPATLFISANKEEMEYRASPVNSDIGHTYIYSDDVENLVIVPSSPVSTNLCVDVEDDSKTGSKGT